MKIKHKNLPPKYYLIISLVIIGIISTLYMGISVNKWNNKIEKMNDLSTQQSEFIYSTIENQFNILEIFSASLSTEEEFNSEPILMEMKEIVKNSYFNQIGIGNIHFICYDNEGSILNTSEEKFSKNALLGIKTLEYGKNTSLFEEDSFIFSIPIESNNEKSKIIGFVFGVCNEENFHKLLKNEVDTDGSFSIICDSSGNILSGSGNMPYYFHSNNLFEILKDRSYDFSYNLKNLSNDFLSGKKGDIAFSTTEKHILAYYTPLEINDWLVVSILPDKKPIFNFYIIPLFLIAIFILVILFSIFIYKKHINYNLKIKIEKQIAEINKLEELAKLDNTTGLLNNEAGIEKMSNFLSNEGKNQSNGLLIIDFYNYQELYDNFGYRACVELTKNAAKIITQVFHKKNIIMRLNETQFCVLIKEIDSKDIILKHANQLCSLLQFTHIKNSYSINISPFIGISIWEASQKDNSFYKLLEEAEIALKFQKKSLSSGYYCFDQINDIKDIESIRSNINQANYDNGLNIQISKILSEMDGGILIVKITTEIELLYISPSYFKMPGVDISNRGLKNQGIFQFISPEDYSIFRETLFKTANTGNPSDIVYRVLDNHWHQMRVSKINEKNNIYSLLLCLITDVSDMKIDELHGKLKQKKIELMIDSSKIASFEIDLTTNTLTLSDTFISIYNCDNKIISNLPQSIANKGYINKKSVPVYLSMYDDILTGEPKGSIEIKIRTKKESNYYTPVKITWKNVFNNEGLPLKTIGIVETVISNNSILDDITKELSSLQAKLILQEKYFKHTEQYQKDLRRYRHDRKNNLIALKALLEKGDVKGAKNYLLALDDILKKDINMINTENPAIDALISEKINHAQRAGIKVEHLIGLPPQIDIDPMDLSLAIGCCLDNAIEACQNAIKTIAHPYINIQLIEKRGVIIFKMVNTSTRQELTNNNLPSTTKEDKLNHGFGMKNVQSVVDKYNGHFEYYTDTDNNTFITKFTLFIRY